MSHDSDLAWRDLLTAACRPYRLAGRFAWHFARGKLNGDPVFRHVLSHGLIPSGARVLDLGCGQGLLSRLLLTAAWTPLLHGWPAEWGPRPAQMEITGIDLHARDVARARIALADAGRAAHVIRSDLRDVEFPASDAVVLFDVLQYLPLDDQNRVLQRAHQALQPAGRLLMRVGDAGVGGRYALSQAVDCLVRWARGHGLARTTGRPVSAWVAQLQALGFTVRQQPMGAGTPFPNVLLVADCQGADA